MSIRTKIIAFGLTAMLKAADKMELIDKLADNIDDELDKLLDGSSEKVQRELVESILLPLCERLMLENQDGYIEILKRTVRELDGADT